MHSLLHSRRGKESEAICLDCLLQLLQFAEDQRVEVLTEARKLAAPNNSSEFALQGQPRVPGARHDLRVVGSGRLAAGPRAAWRLRPAEGKLEVFPDAVAVEQQLHTLCSS